MQQFKKARPVWAAGFADAMNTQTVFTCSLPRRGGMTLYVSGASSYRVFIDGEFIHYGPARTAKGHARVDEIPLDGYLKHGGVSCNIAIEAMGYRCFSITAVNQKSFVCAEVRGADGEVFACTGRDFTCRMPGTRVRRVMRYSRQRQFSEVWDFRGGVRDFGEYPEVPYEVLELPLVWLPRRVPMPDYSEVSAFCVAGYGGFTHDGEKPFKRAPYNDDEILGEWGGWRYEDIEFKPFWFIQQVTLENRAEGLSFPLELSAGEYAIIDLGHVEAGFLCPEFDASEESDIIVGYNENGSSTGYSIPRMTAVNVTEYLVREGESFACETFEPYTLRYAIILVKSGKITLRGFSVKRMRFSVDRIKQSGPTGDATLRSIWDAAVRTFTHNVVDIYMDCPSRERGGWLCDSYYTAQVEHFLTGGTQVEEAFLENFVLRPDDKAEESAYGRVVPAGMLPMVYPADVISARFIPQWAMWFVLEVDHYLRIRNPGADREYFRKTILDLVGFFCGYENEDGLLEKLPAWNFIEWSAANKWGHDVNYPTNFLYAEMLDCVSRLFGLPEYGSKAASIREKTIARSFDGEFFIDNAVRDESEALRNTENRSEACQYYAIRFGHINLSEDKYAVLRHAVYELFGPARTDALPEIEKANALMGIYLRMEILLAEGKYQRLLDEISGYFGYMAEKTGTLWEYTEAKGSLDHGFASFAGYAMVQALDALGKQPD